MTELQVQALNKTRYWIDFANDKYGTDIPYPNVSFKLKGRCAGKARYRDNEVRYNAVLLEENGEKFLKRTVPHEVAHMVVRYRFSHRPRVQPHGYEWKRVMMDFGLEPSRCHSYDTSNSAMSKRGVKKGFEYKCNCRTFNLTIIRHRRIQKGAQYTCRNCKTPLKAIA